MVRGCCPERFSGDRAGQWHLSWPTPDSLRAYYRGTYSRASCGLTMPEEGSSRRTASTPPTSAMPRLSFRRLPPLQRHHREVFNVNPGRSASKTVR